VKSPRGSHIKWSNPYGDQTTHFIDYTKSPNAQNSCCNCKKTRTTSNVGPTICVTSANEGKMQVGWADVVRRKAQR